MGFKILLADDSVTVQKIITLTFSDEGVDVLTVNNGDEAIHRLQYMRPALVMADVSIPGKNGYEICEYVKNHPEMKDTPVVLLVPAFEPFDEERARRIGADQHLTKPFQSIRTLITTVKTLIEGHPPKFATGSLNNAVAQVQAPEPIKAPIVEAASVVEIIRPTQPFADKPEEEITPIVEAIKEPVVDIWKAEEVWEIEDVLDVETDPVTLAPESPAEIEEVDLVIEETPVAEPEPILL
ncbi:MAG: response regulator, partial [Acidobacteriota bacterium]